MKCKLLIAVILSVASFNAALSTSGRGFGGGGFGGGGFHGGGFGGGGFGGGGDFHGGGFGGGGFGGGGFHGGGLGGGGFGGGVYHGGGFGAGGFGTGGASGGGEFHGGIGAGGYNAGFHGDGFNNSGLGGLYGGDGFRGAGGYGLQSGGFRGEFGGLQSSNRGLGAFSSFSGIRRGELPTASRLNSFLGLPTDSGIHQANGFEHPYGYTGSARGLSTFNPATAGGREASGHVYEGPDGATIAHGSVGERGAVVGPNRAAAGARGAVVGPNAAAGGARRISGTAVRGPEGTVVAHGSAVTRSWSAADLRVQGNYARRNFHDYNAFNHGWWHDHPNAWWGGGYAAGFWAGASWASVNNWFGVDWPVYGYMYGNDLTYVDNNVCLYGEPIATAAEYYDSAADLVQTGEQANVPSQPPPQNEPQANSTDPDNAQWLPLGVFEAIPAGKESSDMMFQLAVNKAGIIRGNYYDTADKNVQLIQGSVDKETKRVAWVVANKKNIIFDCGLYNLTQSETPVLVHMGKDKQEQWTLVRLQQRPSDTKTQ